MITFKNRYAEFDNLDDSYNENVLRNCYNREYRRNFFNFNRFSRNGKGNLRYPQNKNFNDIRLSNNYFNNNLRQKSFTPFLQLPIINNNNMNYNHNDQYQSQNNLQSKSSPDIPSILLYNKNNMNHIGSPFPRYNNNFSNNESGFISNNYDTNNLNNDNIQFSNENNILNIRNDSQYIQENYSPNSSQISIGQNLDNELDELEKERKLLLDQEKLNQIDFELRYLRQKRNADLQRRLIEQQQNLNYINKLKEIELENIYYNNNQINSNNNSSNFRRVNYNYRIRNTRNNNNNPYNNVYLEEKINSNLMDDKYYIDELIEKINRMKISQQEANLQFQKKMEDLIKQNESIKMENQKMIEKIKDMKNVLSEKKNYDYNIENNYDYLIKERNNIFRQRKSFENNDYVNNSKSINFKNKNNFKSLDIKKIEENNNKYNNYFLDKKDNDIEEFNMLNQNLVSKSNKVVVTPLLYDSNNDKYKINFNRNTPYNNYTNKNWNEDSSKIEFFTIGNDNSNTRKENLYSIIRKNNDRLDKIREIEEKN